MALPQSFNLFLRNEFAAARLRKTFADCHPGLFVQLWNEGVAFGHRQHDQGKGILLIGGQIARS